jgi:alkanesulfonate monooxygenase SsuD/methylene tetrahydromethanopterin reductase-like flavin-dependent oxidoreductase (luciferase family)
LCVSLAHVTHEIPFFTSIQGIYGIHPHEMGGFASHVHEISGGRFRLGLGVSHEAMVRRLGVTDTRPLADMRSYVDALRQNERYSGALPPLYLAALRDRMLDLSVEIADGALWANASLRHTAVQVGRVPAERHSSFHLACMIPTVISDDREAAAAINRRTLTTYVGLPNYRNYWRAAGYVEEMDAIEAVLATGDRSALPGAMSDTWLADCTAYGSVDEVRAHFAAWREIGVEPIAVMSSTSGGQAVAIRELFAAYA